MSPFSVIITDIVIVLRKIAFLMICIFIGGSC